MCRGLRFDWINFKWIANSWSSPAVSPPWPAAGGVWGSNSTIPDPRGVGTSSCVEGIGRQAQPPWHGRWKLHRCHVRLRRVIRTLKILSLVSVAFWSRSIANKTITNIFIFMILSHACLCLPDLFHFMLHPTDMQYDYFHDFQLSRQCLHLKLICYAPWSAAVAQVLSHPKGYAH